MTAVRCEDSPAGCPECIRARRDKRVRRGMPRCSVCGSANGLRRDGKGYRCMDQHLFEDGRVLRA